MYVKIEKEINQQNLVKEEYENYEKLGRNLWLTIFSYLNRYSLISCEKTCKKWKGFINSKNHLLNDFIDNKFYDLQLWETWDWK